MGLSLGKYPNWKCHSHLQNTATSKVRTRNIHFFLFYVAWNYFKYSAKNTPNYTENVKGFVCNRHFDSIVVIEQPQCLLSDNEKRYKHKFISISINPNAIIFANG